MASAATTMYLREGTPLTEAVTKIAGAHHRPLTVEHARRICEMTYHDAYERVFRDPSQSSVVSFDPPDAEKVGSDIRAAQVQSFRDKLATADAAAASGGSEKAASAPGWSPPAARNHFLEHLATGTPMEDRSVPEARDILKTASTAVRDAVKEVEVRVGTAKLAHFHAYGDLRQQVRHEVTQGASASGVLAAVSSLMPEGTSDKIASGIIEDLAETLLEDGEDLDVKEASASLSDFAVNRAHPLAARVQKVASLRGFRVSGEIALSDLRDQQARVERELQSTLFQ